MPDCVHIATITLKSNILLYNNIWTDTHHVIHWNTICYPTEKFDQ